MKTCPTCKIEKSTTAFGRNSSKRDGLQASCKECRVVQNARYYKATPEHNPARLSWKRRRKAELRERIWQYKLVTPCIDCGETDPVVLEFDHVRGVKFGNISTMVASVVSDEILREEISKCEIRCANCHRRATAQRGGFYNGGVIAEMVFN